MNQAKELEREIAKVKARKDYPHLTEVVGYNHRVAATKNIRIELKKEFPGVKFSIKSKSYSGGDSINVSWTDGPTRSMVEQVVDKYQEGTFDGMTDSYNYDDRAFTEVFGGAKYVFADRRFSDAVYIEVINQVAKDWGVAPLSIEDYRNGGAWGWKTESGHELAREVNLALAAINKA